MNGTDHDIKPEENEPAWLWGVPSGPTPPPPTVETTRLGSAPSATAASTKA